MRKGQEEAPIELLLAVTLLTFVLIIGFYTYQNMCGSLFEQKMRNALSSFASMIEIVYQGGIGTSKTVSVDFAETGCTANIQSIRLLAGTEGVCMKNVGKDNCLEFVAVKQEGESKRSQFMVHAMNVPSSVIVSLVGTDCEDSTTLDTLTEWDNNDIACAWSATVHSFRITKKDADKIEIEELG